MKRISFNFTLIAVFCLGHPTIAQTSLKADLNNAGLELPAKFGALVVAKDLGRARHITVNTNGDVYIKLERLKNGNGIIRLVDNNDDGRADIQSGFGSFVGTGIAIKNRYLYASSNSNIYRYRLNDANEIENAGNPDLIVSGLVDRGQHNSKSITLDNDGNIYVNIGAYSNACQQQDRTAKSAGIDPCPILDVAGGIWKFKANKLNQSFADGERYATGLRNVVGLDWNSRTNELYVVQHGRDQLYQLYPEYYDQKQGAELPAEEMFRVKEGGDYGWPYCYYDQHKKQKLLAPEYGGDGKTAGRCADKEKPIVAFPGHIAPNALLFYTGDMFPERYKNGAFIAFHGSWNRSPEKQEGFYVVFQPFKDGKPHGDWEVFADGFAQKQNIVSPRDAAHRPCGVAQAPDGSLYVSDDAKGYVWRIFYKN